MSKHIAMKDLTIQEAKGMPVRRIKGGEEFEVSDEFAKEHLLPQGLVQDSEHLPDGPNLMDQENARRRPGKNEPAQSTDAEVKLPPHPFDDGRMPQALATPPGPVPNSNPVGPSRAGAPRTGDVVTAHAESPRQGSAEHQKAFGEVHSGKSSRGHK